MTVKIILNPYSNRWHAQERWGEAEAAFRAAGVKFSLSISTGPKHAVELAAFAAEAGFSPIIAAGGDGTIGDVVNGIARVRGEQAMGVIGIMPLGTANDLAFNLGIPLNLREAAQVIAAGKTRRIDMGNVNGVYFANNSAIGLEPYVTMKQVKIDWISGVPRYLVAAVQGILDHPSWKAVVEWDDGSYNGPLSLVSVGNGPRTGGLFYMSPHADVSDGKLTFVLAYRPTRLSTFAILPKTMNPKGDFVHESGIQEIDTTRLRISLDHASPAHADGELFSVPVTELDYRIIPGALQMLVP